MKIGGQGTTLCFLSLENLFLDESNNKLKFTIWNFCFFVFFIIHLIFDKYVYAGLHFIFWLIKLLCFFSSKISFHIVHSSRQWRPCSSSCSWFWGFLGAFPRQYWQHCWWWISSLGCYSFRFWEVRKTKYYIYWVILGRITERFCCWCCKRTCSSCWQLLRWYVLACALFWSILLENYESCWIIIFIFCTLYLWVHASWYDSLGVS